MKRGSLIAAAAIVLVANVFALAHAWRNRSGHIEADITLTERELELSYNSNGDDSEVALNVRWNPQTPWLGGRQMPWLDQESLRELGFDTTVSPSDDAAQEFYQRQRPLRVFVALEYGGPAWRKWLDSVDQQVREHPELPNANFQRNQLESASRLIAIDANISASKLRAEHPDRGAVVIVPAVISIAVEPYYFAGQNRVQTPPKLVGIIEDIPSSIHIPLPFSDGFRHLAANHNSARYHAHLRYGASLEPWIVGIELPPPASR